MLSDAADMDLFVEDQPNAVGATPSAAATTGAGTICLMCRRWCSRGHEARHARFALMPLTHGAARAVQHSPAERPRASSRRATVQDVAAGAPR